MSRQAPARHFRQFMEWAKSVLASQALSKGDCLVELCVGKGLDAGKWERAGVARGLFLEPESDESSVSLAEADGWLQKCLVQFFAPNKDEAIRVWSLRTGVCIMDEVDWVLHPLKSELNFPCGVRMAAQNLHSHRPRTSDGSSGCHTVTR